MTRLILSTSNIVSSGAPIIRRNGGSKSNDELLASLRANFLAAQQDYSPPSSSFNTPRSISPCSTSPATNGNSPKTNCNSTNGIKPSRPPPSIWTTRSGSDLYIPTIDWTLSGLEAGEEHDITLKLFFLPGANLSERKQLTEDALALVTKELGVQSIDLLILSFPGLSFEGDCEYAADRINSQQGNDEEELASWPIFEDLHARGVVRRLGIAEFGSAKLSKFLQRVKVRPVVDQINVKDCCNVPPPLIELAKREGIELLAHNDCNEILPKGTLRELLGQGENGAGVISNKRRMSVSEDGRQGEVEGWCEITPKWVVKYTAVVRDRGVIENKGYFAVAELEE